MNDPWIEIWLECQRIAFRALGSARTWWNRRALAKAEHQLGELGWQQAHFDPRDSRFSALQKAEQDQAHLHFECAEIREKIAHLITAASEKTTFLTTSLTEAEAHANHSENEAVRQLAALEAERQRGGPEYLIESLKKHIADDENRLRLARNELSQRREALALHELETRQKLDALEKSLRVLETEIAELDHKKSTHFTHIGHELADVGIAPMNQPELLPRVLALRESLETLQAERTASFGATAALPFRHRIAALIVASLITLMILFLGYLIVATVWQIFR